MLVAGPNLTIDRTAVLGELRPGEVLRFDRVVVTPGGKGLNVARAALALGHSALLVSLLPGHTVRAAAALIAEEGVELSGVPCGGELRSRCPECDARFSSAFAVECEACGGALRPAEAFGGPIRKPGR